MRDSIWCARASLPSALYTLQGARARELPIRCSALRRGLQASEAAGAEAQRNQGAKSLDAEPTALRIEDAESSNRMTCSGTLDRV